jgi:hypothetical protein
MKTKKWLVPSAIILIVASTFSCFFVGKSILAHKKTNKQAITFQKNNESITTNAPARNNSNKELRVQDYFPSKTMTKQFSGGYENQGFKYTIDKIDEDKVQVKEVNSGTGAILIYQVSDNDIRLIFGSEVPDGKFKENYIGTVQPNDDKIILKAPLEVGTKWNDKDDSDSKYEITGINVEVKTPAGTFTAVEVTFLRGDIQTKSYYVKDLGLVKTSTIGNESELIKVE